MTAPPNRGTLAVLFTGVLVGALDIAIVGPALPSIQQTFGVDTRALQWVFSAYVLVGLIAAPLVAKLSDRHSRRTVYAVCLAVFGAGSLFVAVAPGFGWLLAGRAVQALGAGGLLPVAGAVVADAFPADRRGRVLGLIGAVFGVAFVIGPLVGGILLKAGWRWLFLVNLPLVIVLVAASLKVLPRGGGRPWRGFDWLGAGVLGAGLATLVWGLGQVDVDESWETLARRCVPFLVAAGASAVVFWHVETRARDPIVEPSLLRSRQLRLVGVVALATGIVEAGMVFLPSLAVLAFRVSPSTASFMLLPLVACLIVGSPTAGRLLDRFGAKPVIQTGLGLTAVGLLVLAHRPLELWTFYTGAGCVGLGLAGLLGAPLRFVALEEAGKQHRGASQGLLTVFLSTGRLVGAAVIGGVVATGGASELEGFRHALAVLAVIALAAALGATTMRARAGPPDESPGPRERASG